MSNTSNLGSKVVLLFSEEEWIGINWVLKISRESNFNASGCFNVLGVEIWKKSPS
jgi:hypothetical protein